jgi:hypothetical protein
MTAYLTSAVQTAALKQVRGGTDRANASGLLTLIAVAIAHDLAEVGVVSEQPLIATLTDNTGGTHNDTLVVNSSQSIISIPVVLATIGAGDVVTEWTPGFAGKILGFDFITTVVASTAAKAATLNLEIGTTNVTGGLIALTTAGCDTLGKVVAGSAITGTNTFTAADTISIEGSLVTAFSQGEGVLLLRVTPTAVNDNMADLAQKIIELLASLKTANVIADA